MARRRRERMSEGKKNIIAGLIQEYNIKSAEDIQEALKDLLGGTIQEMMEAELDEHLGYEGYETFVETSADINADFCLTAKGDSMINARIFDGDIVFIKAQPQVENGEIAAVIVNDEATLKRVYLKSDRARPLLL